MRTGFKDAVAEVSPYKAIYTVVVATVSATLAWALLGIRDLPDVLRVSGLAVAGGAVCFFAVVIAKTITAPGRLFAKQQRRIEQLDDRSRARIESALILTVTARNIRFPSTQPRIVLDLEVENPPHGVGVALKPEWTADVQFADGTTAKFHDVHFWHDPFDLTRTALAAGNSRPFHIAISEKAAALDEVAWQSARYTVWLEDRLGRPLCARHPFELVERGES